MINAPQPTRISIGHTGPLFQRLLAARGRTFPSITIWQNLDGRRSKNRPAETFYKYVKGNKSLGQDPDKGSKHEILGTDVGSGSVHVACHGSTFWAWVGVDPTKDKTVDLAGRWKGTDRVWREFDDGVVLPKEQEGNVNKRQ